MNIMAKHYLTNINGHFVERDNGNAMLSTYNVRLGEAMESMEKYSDMFDRASLLVLSEVDNSDRLATFSIIGHQQKGGEDTKAMSYPNKSLKKRYMIFKVTPLETGLNLLVNHCLINKLIEIKSTNVNGTPIFIEAS